MLWVMWVQDVFVDEYDPTIEDSFHTQFVVDDEACLIHVQDTAGQEEYSFLREYVPPKEGFVFVYSVTDRNSFRWLPSYFTKVEQALSCSIADVPCVLVGNKIDLEEMREVGKKEGAALARENGMMFLEISCKTRVNVDETFVEVVRAIRRGGRGGGGRRGCSMM